MKIATKLGTNQYIIIALTLITAVVHLSLTRSGGSIMLLNGLGYLGLLVAYFVHFDFLSIKRDWIRWAYMAYAALTFVAYFARWGMDAFSSPVGLVTKIIELGLILMLWRENR